MTKNETAWKLLCVHFCKTYGISWEDLFGADRRARKCYRARGPGRPVASYPSLLVSSTLPFLLLASQRKTRLTIEQVAKCLDLDPWEALHFTTEAEARLSKDQTFAENFELFLDSVPSEEREQSSAVENAVAMTYQEIAAKMGISWQRVQQIEQRALRKLRTSKRAQRILQEIMN